MPSLRLLSLAGGVAALALFAAPATARADDAKFGHAGQFALHLGDDFTVNANDVLQGPQIQGDVFVIDHLSLGLMLGVQWFSGSVEGSSSTASTFLVRVGPRLGYDAMLSDKISFWPQIGFDFRTETNSASGGGTSTTFNAGGLTVVAPIVLHPTPGFFIGTGPFLYTEFLDNTNSGPSTTDNGKITSVGLMAMIGGAI